MPLGPRFSAQKFQTVLKTAFGGSSDAARAGLQHIGATKMLKTGADLKTAKAAFGKLLKTGAIKEEGVAKAKREFGRAEKVAVYANRMQQKELREERLNMYRTEKTAEQKTLPQSVVREQAHSVSIAGDSSSQHRVSISQSDTKRATGVAGLAKAGGAKPTTSVSKPIDVMID